jgi:TetR/AcrR family transcriptional regulator
MPFRSIFCDTQKSTHLKRERRKDARPGELLAAALDLFVEKGFAATRAEEVAQRAGVSKGTLFLYFTSKEELFKAVVRENISDHYPNWHEQMQAYSGSTADMLHLCAQGWWEHIGATKASGISKLMMTEGSNFPDLSRFYQDEVIEPGNAMILRILQRGVDRGEFRGVNLKYAVHSFVAPLLYLAVWKHSVGPGQAPSLHLNPQEFLTAQVDTLLHGLCIQGVVKPAPVLVNLKTEGNRES